MNMPDEDYVIETEDVLNASPEPENKNEIALVQSMMDDSVHIASICQYDNIGDVLTPDTIGQYLDRKFFSRDVQMTVLHNSGTPAKSDKGHSTVVGFHNYHVDVRKWKCIGYHFVISTDGSIRAARKMSFTGAHAGQLGNPKSIGVCLVGNFEVGDRPTQAQKVSFARLHEELHKHYYGNANLTVRFHREFMSTGCPGNISVDEVMRWVNEYGSGNQTEGSSDKPLIILNGAKVGNGIIVKEVTYAPLRSVFEGAGFTVKWQDRPYYRVMLTGPELDPSWALNWPSPCGGIKENPLIVLGGTPLDRGVLYEGDTYAPLRSVFEGAGFTVKWNGAPKYTIEIES